MNPEQLSNRAFNIRNGKAQWVRVLDVLVIGPLMVAGGMALTKKSAFSGVALGAMGFGTVVFNAYNWWLVEQAKRLQLAAQQEMQ